MEASPYIGKSNIVSWYRYLYTFLFLIRFQYENRFSENINFHGCFLNIIYNFFFQNGTFIVNKFIYLQIIHLKRFDYVNTKWVKTQKVVNFPFKDFDPTAYLASVPQHTILRHKQLQEQKKDELEHSIESQPEKIMEESEVDSSISNNKCNNSDGVKINMVQNGPTEHCKLLQESDLKVTGSDYNVAGKNKVSDRVGKGRARLESTSLLKTPIIDEHLKDYHEHKLLPGQDKFDLKYQLYAVVVSKIY